MDSPASARLESALEEGEASDEGDESAGVLVADQWSSELPSSSCVLLRRLVPLLLLVVSLGGIFVLYASRLRVQEEAHALDRRRRVDFSEGLELIVLNRSFPQMPVPSNADQRKRVAACVFDVNQAVDYIAESVLAIRSSVQTCPDKTLGAACSTTVNGALEALLWAATAVAAAATDCAKTQNAKAVCATDSLCIAANLAEIASAGSGVRAACVLGEDSQFDLQLTEDAENRQAQLAACVFEAMHATA
eukprot:TRINITY_DN19007_c0_g1_i6.p1 TRINITY_DN19007_c0_g1~~TRINITY_DN19007_c0_g1_i6.p1  ORF type:complete len:248 (-),score=43.85 TRINITY_DN19007_c0_g1_i6:103-846(-)